MLATLVDRPFDRKGWIFEIKYDGYRAFGVKDRAVSLISRNQKSFTGRFSSIAAELKKIPGRFILDGELVLLDEKGKSSFQLIQNYNKTKEGTPYYYVFDILVCNGKDLRPLPLIQRKEILRNLLKQAKLKQIRYSDHIEEKGTALFRVAVKKGFEGIIGKKEDSTYVLRRSSDWVKIKTHRRQEVVIGGYTEPKGSRSRFGALLVGVYEKGKLIYAGHVGGGFNSKLLKEMHEKLKKIHTPICPFAVTPRPNTPVTWVKPKLVCEVAFAEWTQEGILRQPIFKGLRIDKSPKEVVREKAKRMQ